MGINNLLSALKSIAVKSHLRNYEDKKIGIDGHCWIHKSLFTNLKDKEYDENSNTFLYYLKHKINMLKKYNINIFFVIDGKRPKIKSATIDNREKQKSKQKKLALKEKNESDLPDDEKNLVYKKRMIQSMGITPQIIEKVKDLLMSLDIKIIESPYEADHQLTYMYKSGLIDAILTEDTDLFAHGNNNILYKLDNEGNCFCLSFRDLNQIQEFKDFNEDSFLVYCILCGCDYFKMDGVGPKAAYIIAKKYANKLNDLLIYLKTGVFKKPQIDLAIKFLKAYLAFKMGVVTVPFMDTIMHKNGNPRVNNYTEVQDDILKSLMEKYEIFNLNFLF